MAAISSAPTPATALTPPSSSHGEAAPWVAYPGEGRFKNATDDKAGAAARFIQENKLPRLSQNGNTLSSSANQQSDSHGSDMAVRKTHSMDNASAAARWDKSADHSGSSPPLAVEPKPGRISPSDWPMHNNQQNMTDDRKRPMPQTFGLELRDDFSSKWIHRDKLAKIESEELQAAGIFVPRSRPPSKQRREQSQNRLARGTESIDMGHTHPGGQPRKNSATAEHLPPTALVSSAEPSPSAPHWDLRTPEEIAQEEKNAAYFTSNGIQGGSRIPVAKTSPAPIPLDYLERGSQAVRNHNDTSEVDSTAARRQSENPEVDTISFSKSRSRSASLSVSDRASTITTGPHTNARRSVTDISPKKHTPRKSSIASKTSSSTGKSKTRAGLNKDSLSTRPSTRAGEPKAPEGDPPWMLNSYKPDPRLPPDQQLLPTVARRLQQEKWEKEGRFGDTYDKEFRPLNDKDFSRQPPEPGQDNNDDKIIDNNQTEEEIQKQSDEWPLKQGATKSPTLRQGSYSTMPKIVDMPSVSPMTTSPRTPITQQPTMMAQAQEPPTVPDASDSGKKKGGCWCCVVM